MEQIINLSFCCFWELGCVDFQKILLSGVVNCEFVSYVAFAFVIVDGWWCKKTHTRLNFLLKFFDVVTENVEPETPQSASTNQNAKELLILDENSKDIRKFPRARLTHSLENRNPRKVKNLKTSNKNRWSESVRIINHSTHHPLTHAAVLVEVQS